ncbi:uncharacterized protein LOC125943845 [Dermacentor silvarum]|uniref:uncharacterized protein LOC125943845 n=1 Tax=Dermacentor silvarum TaxID=543639 RepID=UPI0021017EC8|nr:uncharacterized protein LOC125943845 [Dermacentor silvarum]
MKDVRDREEAELLSGIAVPDVAQKCTCCSSGCNIAGEFEQLKEEAAVERRELQERVSELQALNARLQKALTSKIFASESRIISASMDVSVTAAPTRIQGPNVVARDRTVDLPFTAATSSAATTESSRAMPEEEERHGTGGSPLQLSGCEVILVGQFDPLESDCVFTLIVQHSKVVF